MTTRHSHPQTNWPPLQKQHASHGVTLSAFAKLVTLYVSTRVVSFFKESQPYSILGGKSVVVHCLEKFCRWGVKWTTYETWWIPMTQTYLFHTYTIHKYVQDCLGNQWYFGTSVFEMRMKIEWREVSEKSDNWVAQLNWQALLTVNTCRGWAYDVIIWNEKKRFCEIKNVCIYEEQYWAVQRSNSLVE